MAQQGVRFAASSFHMASLKDLVAADSKKNVATSAAATHADADHVEGLA